jgi:4-amino-4-deoxy-L-arabinose transferase-like glycosyltransferase
MSEPSGSLRNYLRTHRFSSALGLIAIAGLIARIAYAVLLQNHEVGGDGFRYHFGAILLADGEGFANPLNPEFVDTGHPPGWTILLALPTTLGLRTWFEHQIVTAVVGSATIVMVGVAARKAFGSRVGLIAAALTALYPNIVLYEREVLSEPLAMLGIATMIWLAYAFIARPRAGLAAALGAVLGALAMTKSDLAVLSLLLVAPLILSRREIDLGRRVGWLAMAGAICIAIMAPWSVYLSTRYDQPVLLAGGLGVTMLAGNCPATYEGELLAYYDFACVLRSRGQLDNPIDGDANARDEALDFIRDHKGRAPIVAAARLGRALEFYRPFQQVELETERGSPSWVFHVALFAYWALLPLGIAGAVIARRRSTPIYPLLVFVIAVVLAVLPTIGSVRYRAPAEIPLVILAAVALEAALRAFRDRRGRVVARV